MLYNYLKVIFRNFISDGMYSFIIVVGLAIGLASMLVIGQYIYFELSFDKNVKDRERIYYTYVNWEGPKGGVDGKCFPAVAPFMDASIPEVESSVRIANIFLDRGSSALLRREENGKLIFYAKVNNLFIVDPEVLNFFSIPLLAGDAATALKEPNSMVITQSLAEKFFPNEDPINKMLTLQNSTIFKGESRVTGVVKDPSPNATFQFNALYSMANLKQGWKDIDNAWLMGEFQTFTKLYPGSDFKAVGEKVNALAKPLRPLEDQLKVNLSLHLYPFEDFHFFRHNNSATTEGIQFSGDKKLLRYLFLFSILILIISLANYINLTTARALKRAKEVGVRKVNGASRKNLIIQFLIEFSFLNAVSFLLAFTLAQFLFPVLARTIGSSATWIFWTNPTFWIVTALIFIFCTSVSGIYPAVILSGYKPASILKGNFARSQSGMMVRKGLVLVQFSLSVIMIMSIYVIARQLFFMQGKDLGISVDQVLVVNTNEIDMTLKRDVAFERFRSGIEGVDNVISTSSSADFPGTDVPRAMVFHHGSDAEKKARPLLTNQVGVRYIKTMGLELLHGSDFTTDPVADSGKVVINETAAQELGFSTPQEAIGELIIFPETKVKYEVIGIIKDFSLNLKEPVGGEAFFKHYLHPNFHTADESPAEFFLLKLSTHDLGRTLTKIEGVWKKLFPQTPFDYFFLDSHFNTFYKEEKQFARVIAFFSVLGILVTCMGLFGLSLYDTNSRTKEIGIRKSLGASVRSIMWLFSRDYMKLVLIASVITVPVGIFLLHEWLKNYPQRIELAADSALLPLILMGCIALAAVGYHTYQTARIDPVKSLKAD